MLKSLVRKEDELPPINENIKRLFQVIYADQKKNQDEESNDGTSRIKVSSFLSKMSFYYEKIRNSVDYNEDHLLRKNAIERILKRELIIQGSLKTPESEQVARHLLTELIRATYLANNKIPEDKIDEIAKIIEKYIKLKNYSLNYLEELEDKSELINWIIALASSDIEERINNSLANEVIVKTAYNVLSDLIGLADNSPYKKDKDIQIYLAIERKILKFDDDMAGFVLFKYYAPEWREAGDELIIATAKNILAIKEKIAEQINHPLRAQLSKIANRYVVFFSVLTDVIKSDPKVAYVQLQKGFSVFSYSILSTCQRKYKEARRRLWRAAFRSILYIFITKSIFVFFLESPVSKWLGEPVNFLALGINIGFPAFLLFLVTLFTRVPSSDNTEKIISGIEEIMFKKERDKCYVLKQPIQRSKSINIVFGLIYAATFFASFGFIIWGLNKINFNFLSIIIFLFFLAFVSFFSIRIRKAVNDLKVIETKENIFSFLIDFFYTPIIATGKWLSEKFARINVFVFILDFIIEAPFKTFVEIAEEWTKYVRERKEEIS